MGWRRLLAPFLTLSLAACTPGDNGAATARATLQPSSSTHSAPASSPAADTSRSSDWAQLAARPLRLPLLADGQPCPQAALSRPAPDRFGAGLGDGPVYAVGGQGVKSSPSSAGKVLWVARPSYTGPIRIRGGQVDGDGQLLLGGPFHNYWSGQPVKNVSGTDLYPELDLLEAGTPTGSPWRAWPSATFIATAGCYAWQVGGLDFTQVITIQA